MTDLIDDTGRRERIAALGFDPAVAERSSISVCAACGGSRFVEIVSRDRYGFAQPADCCTACGLTFLNPVLTDEEYAAFYRGTYRPLVSAFHGRLIDAESIQVEQRAYGLELARHLQKTVAFTSPVRMIDVGGSTGVVAEAVGEVLAVPRDDTVVLDPSPDELGHAARRGFGVVPGTLESLGDDLGTFQLVLMCQTADHLTDIAGALRKVRALVAADGWAFIDIVDFRAAYLRNWSVEAAVKVDHPYYLTQETFSALLAAAGFSVSAMWFAADHLHVGFLCHPTEPRAFSIEPEHAPRLLRELRYVQNARRW